MKWNFKPALKALDDIATYWGSINPSSCGHLLLDPILVTAAVRHFAGRRVLFGSLSDGRGAVLVEPIAPGLWQTFQPAQAPLGFVAFAPNSTKAEQRERLFLMIQSLPGYALQLGVLKQDSAMATTPDPNPRVQPIPYLETGRLRCDTSFDSYWLSRSNDLRNNLERRLRKLEMAGDGVKLVPRRCPEEMVHAVHEYSRIEAAGWKGQAGTAVDMNSAQGQFYREIMEEFSKKGEAIVFELHLNGKVIASNLVLRRDRVAIGLKTTYDENYKSYSPGFLLKYFMFRQMFEDHGIDSYEFFGQLMQWQLKWVTDTRPMYHLNYYRRPWVPLVRDFLKSWRNARTFSYGHLPRR